MAFKFNGFVNLYLAFGWNIKCSNTISCVFDLWASNEPLPNHELADFI